MTTNGSRKDLSILQAIKNISQSNDEIITRIRNKDLIVAYTYKINTNNCDPSDGFINISETKVNFKASELLSTWKPVAEMIVVSDFFNDKIVWKCDSFEDIVYLNTEMSKVAEKWIALEGTTAAITSLENFSKNFTTLHKNLCELEEKLKDHQSNLSEFDNHTKQLNKMIKELNDAVVVKNIETEKLISSSRKERTKANKEEFGIATVLLQKDHVTTINSWINPEQQQRKWKLLYRASFDGYEASNFHKSCDNKGPTVTIIRSKSGHLFGGYTPLSWTSCSKAICDLDTFIFTLTNPHNISPTKYGHRSWSIQESIFDHPSYGPCYGNDPNIDNDFSDILIVDKCDQNENQIHFPGSFMDAKWWGYGNKTFTGNNNFEVDDIEVFGLVQLQTKITDENTEK